MVQAALCLSPCFAFAPKSAIQNVICICNYYAIVDNEPSKSSEEELSLTETKSWWLDERIEACRSTINVEVLISILVNEKLKRGESAMRSEFTRAAECTCTQLCSSFLTIVVHKQLAL